MRHHSYPSHSYPSSCYDDQLCLKPPLLSLFAAAADLYFLVYILTARRVRDAFSEFPVPLPAAAPINSARK